MKKQTGLTGAPKHFRYLAATTFYVTLPHKNATANSARLAIAVCLSPTRVVWFQQSTKF